MFYNIPTLPVVDHEDGEMYGSPIKDEHKIPSELIEPYLQRFLMLALEELAYFNTPVADVKKRLDGVRYFVSCYAGIHAEIATNNLYTNFIQTPDDKLKEMAKKLLRENKEEILK